jgi:hypothetical protein
MMGVGPLPGRRGRAWRPGIVLSFHHHEGDAPPRRPGHLRRLPRGRAEQRSSARAHRRGDRRDGGGLRRAQRHRRPVRDAARGSAVRVLSPLFARPALLDPSAGARSLRRRISIICGRPEHPAHDRQATTNPAVVGEVLSPSTEGDDEGDKHLDFQSLPSLEAYVLVAQDARRVAVYRRDGSGAWAQHPEVLGEGQRFELPRLVRRGDRCSLSRRSPFLGPPGRRPSPGGVARQEDAV